MRYSCNSIYLKLDKQRTPSLFYIWNGWNIIYHACTYHSWFHHYCLSNHYHHHITKFASHTGDFGRWNIHLGMRVLRFEKKNWDQMPKIKYLLLSFFVQCRKPYATISSMHAFTVCNYCKLNCTLVQAPEAQTFLSLKINF